MSRTLSGFSTTVLHSRLRTLSWTSGWSTIYSCHLHAQAQPGCLTSVSFHNNLNYLKLTTLCCLCSVLGCISLNEVSPDIGRSLNDVITQINVFFSHKTFLNSRTNGSRSRHDPNRWFGTFFLKQINAKCTLLMHKPFAIRALSINLSHLS